jgi:hypothetical protein
MDASKRDEALLERDVMLLERDEALEERGGLLIHCIKSELYLAK